MWLNFADGQTWDIKTDKEPYQAYGLDEQVKISWTITDSEQKFDKLHLNIEDPNKQIVEQKEIQIIRIKPDTIEGNIYGILQVILKENFILFISQHIIPQKISKKAIL